MPTLLIRDAVVKVLLSVGWKCYTGLIYLVDLSEWVLGKVCAFYNTSDRRQPV